MSVVKRWIGIGGDYLQPQYLLFKLGVSSHIVLSGNVLSFCDMTHIGLVCDNVYISGHNITPRYPDSKYDRGLEKDLVQYNDLPWPF